MRRPPDSTEILVTEQALIEQALQKRPDMVAARLREQLAEQDIDVAKSHAIPNATASVRYGRESVVASLAAPGRPRTFDRENVVEFGVSIPLPLFNREQGNIAEAASRRVQARAERESLEQSISQEVSLAFHRYQTLKNSLQLLRTGVVGENEQSFRIVQLAYDLGELRFLDIVNQQRQVVEAEASYVTMQTDFNRALADLELAVGAGLRP